MATSTWEAHWRSLLPEEDRGPTREVVQGRSYFRSGRVTDLRVARGLLSGRVQGRQATPRVVEVAVAVLSDDDWASVVELLAGQLRHSARLLAGLQPEGLVEELAAAGVRLLPGPGEVVTTCGCASAQPCAHAAAVWETASERIAEDPFMLLHLRGRGRERLLADIAADRAEQTDQAVSVPVHDLAPAGWRRASAPLEELHLPSEETADARAGLRLLGDPPNWPRGPSADELFGPLIERAARWARRQED